MFADKLNLYINLLGCSAKELSKYSNLSEAAISRYRIGGRIPAADDMDRLCRGIAAIAEYKNISGITLKSVSDDLGKYRRNQSLNCEIPPDKLNLLFKSLSVNISELSKTLNYDSSYISRIRNGQRRPAKAEQFASDVSEYIARCCNSDKEKNIVSGITGIPYQNMQTREAYVSVLKSWLTDDVTSDGSPNSVTEFLEKLNDFDLNEYIRAINFDKLKVPSVPFQLPTTKIYYGLEEMKQGELDFLKATALSKSDSPVFMCSDMQMDDMAADMDFSKKYMFGLAAMLKKGLHLNVVHNLNRPFNELMLGLESWIPLYMTGQISPYYMSGVHNKIYGHFLNVSGSAALTGECIAGHHADGRYCLTKNKEELLYYRQKASFILKKALPLMEIYRSNSADMLNSFLSANSHKKGKRKNFLSALPLYTMNEQYLEDFLQKRELSDADIKNIKRCAASQRNAAQNILENNIIEDQICMLTQEEFEKYPASLSLSQMFYENDIIYSYEEYLSHLRMTREYAKKYPNYSPHFVHSSVFRNIQITVHENEWAMISKNKSPAIHFVIRHPILIDAIANPVFPVTEEI